MWCWESRYFPINSSSQILVTPTIVHRREQWAPNYQEAKERETETASALSEIAFARHFSYHHQLPSSDGLNAMFGFSEFGFFSWFARFQV